MPVALNMAASTVLAKMPVIAQGVAAQGLRAGPALPHRRSSQLSGFVGLRPSRTPSAPAFRTCTRRAVVPAGAVASLGLDAHHLVDTLASMGGLMYSIADAASDTAVQATDAAAAVVQKDNGGFFGLFVGPLEAVLKVLVSLLEGLGVPQAYGFSIILLTILVKAATFPLSKQQIESSQQMQQLQPQIKAIQERYKDDKERMQLETARLYKTANVNPLAGCLPTLATIPVWIGLYRALSNAANEGLLTEGFFWIPSLAGPLSAEARQSGAGTTDWLFPFVNGAPPIGWSDAAAYLVLPVFLTISTYLTQKYVSPTPPPADPDNPGAVSSQILLQILPIMVGFFGLQVPAGLTLYWVTNNVLTTAQTLYFKANKATVNLPIATPGTAARTQATPVSAPPKAAVASSTEGKGAKFAAIKKAELDRKRAEAESKAASMKAANAAAAAAAAEAEAKREPVAVKTSELDAAAKREVPDAPPAAMPSAPPAAAVAPEAAAATAAQASAAGETAEARRRRSKRQRKKD